jgi:S1-C subfamily serine protease
MKEMDSWKHLLTGLGIGVVLTLAVLGGVVLDRKMGKVDSVTTAGREIIDEESVVTGVVEKATASVVTVSISKTNVVNSDPFLGMDFFGGFFGTPSQPIEQKIEQDIGTGFIISEDGLVVTNKHVVADVSAKYRVIIGKDEVVEVVNIYRDPVSDLAILKVNKSGLTPVKLGDSDKLKVGQTVIAIGTALGEFRSTVTKGVISGLGRGITAGSPFEGSEKLDNVIQTDAAINPGNSGGPLFNSSGEVIGVNVAVSSAGQSIGFALPINIVKQSIENFKSTGQFDRPYLGVSYRMVSKQAALLNEVPSGAYVVEVILGSPAEKAEVKVGDIIIEIDGKKLADEKNTVLSAYINTRKIGDTITLKIWRPTAAGGDKKEIDLSVKLEKKS